MRPDFWPRGRDSDTRWLALVNNISSGHPGLGRSFQPEIRADRHAFQGRRVRSEGIDHWDSGVEMNRAYEGVARDSTADRRWFGEVRLIPIECLNFTISLMRLWRNGPFSRRNPQGSREIKKSEKIRIQHSIEGKRIRNTATFRFRAAAGVNHSPLDHRARVGPPRSTSGNTRVGPAPAVSSTNGPNAGGLSAAATSTRYAIPGRSSLGVRYVPSGPVRTSAELSKRTRPP